MTTGDIYHKQKIVEIMEYGRKDVNPRPHYEDGTPAHTLSINHQMLTYNLAEGEFPITTLRPIATKNAIGELLWIYQKQTSNIYVLETELGVRWWREWCVNPYHYGELGSLSEGPNPHKEEGFYYDCKGEKIKIGEKSDTIDAKTDIDEEGNIVDYIRGNILTKDAEIGQVYGKTNRTHNLVDSFFDDFVKDPDGRRHIINMWQEEDFKKPHGLKPCAYQTDWNLRHEPDGDYLDMCLFQRSSDFLCAGAINQTQYVVFQHMVARHLGYKVGKFTWFVANMQIYDRHIKQGRIMLNRTPIDCQPDVWINPDKTDFYSLTPADIKIAGYPMAEIKEKNPQLRFEVGI